MDGGAGFSMSMGPGGNQWCCGKPVGCTMTHDRCSFLNHRWKLDTIDGHRERMEDRRREEGSDELQGQAGQ
jgi:hypothetical protein